MYAGCGAASDRYLRTKQCRGQGICSTHVLVSANHGFPKCRNVDFLTEKVKFSKLFRFVTSESARFYAGAVQLANLGALTRIILSGVLLSKF